MTEGVCRLCGETRPLLSASHVVPAALYRNMKAGATRFGFFENGTGSFSVTPPVASGILCATCDNDVFGEIDRRGVRGLRRGVRPDVVFAASILWRAAISGLPEFIPLAAAFPRDAVREGLLSGATRIEVETVVSDGDPESWSALAPRRGFLLVAGRWGFVCPTSRL